jgi:hypothetical protein
MIETLLIIIIIILLGGGGLIMVLGLGAVAITAIIIGLIIAGLLLAWGTQQLTYIFHPWLIVGCMIAVFIYLSRKNNK